MNFQQLHTRSRAVLLCLVFLASWTVKSSHALLRGHIHHALPVCASGHKNQASHLHDSRFNPDDCSICAFLPAVPDAVQSLVWVQPPKVLVANTTPTTTQFFIPLENASIRLRGPPVRPIFL